MQDVIQITNLNKYFKDVHAVNDLSFSVKKGELFAFLGVNGAGKSTTISIICNTLKKDSGTVLVSGVDVDSDSDDIKRSIGVVFQASVLDKSLTARENLRHRASLYGIFNKDFEDRLEYLSTILDFKDYLDRTVSKLSGGQRRKIDVARALIHNPKILILDEPTTGLDPQTRITMWKVINDLRAQTNMTVLLTTHYMEEAADADYVVIIDGGKKVAEGTPHDLKNQYANDFISVYGIDEEDAQKISADFIKINGGYRFSVKDTSVATSLINKCPELFVDYEVIKGKMDDVFLNVTGKKLTGDK
ncbi:MAG: ABC transporter ATP-binding protein [Clostridia bacterium]|nr:ABC transporter ATP-binding protein [Clostridia bacterium]